MKHVSAVRWAVALALAILVSPIEAEVYQVDATHSSVDFSIRHMIGRSKGHFDSFSGTIAYDPAKPEASTFSGSIQVGSIYTGNEKRDGHLRSPDFFDAEKFAAISFESTKVTKSGEGTLEVTGNLTLHGVTKVITLSVEVLGTGINPVSEKPQVGLAIEFTIKRSDYGVNHWADTASVLGDEVEIEVLIEANAG